MYSIFRVTKDLVMKIDTYIDLVCESVLHFEEGLKLYLSGKDSEFNERLDIIKILEGRADDLRQEIEAQLYVQTLIPESRGDVLQILQQQWQQPCDPQHHAEPTSPGERALDGPHPD